MFMILSSTAKMMEALILAVQGLFECTFLNIESNYILFQYEIVPYVLVHAFNLLEESLMT